VYNIDGPGGSSNPQPVQNGSYEMGGPQTTVNGVPFDCKYIVNGPHICEVGVNC
jgi:hypothetical protein